MIKPKAIDISTTNIALLGSDLEKEVKKAAADCEPAWNEAGKEVGLMIWRIEKFKVVHWPKEEYGNFYSGDSYIILNTYKQPDSDKLLYNAHFWIGKYSTQDEYGTAAYKTVELDDKLGGQPVQFREVMGHESDEFRALFPNGITIMDGGVDTGFRHVEPESYRPRLLHVKGTRKNVTAMEVEMSADSINSGDAFILDTGMKVYQWSGSKAGIFEKSKAAELVRALDDERKSAVEITVCSETSDGDFPWDLLGGKPAAINAPTPDDVPAFEKTVFRVSDATGSLEVTEVAKGAACSLDKFDTNDVFIFDAGSEVFVWVGLGASTTERKEAFSVAQNYLTKAKRPAWLPIVRVLEGAEAESFNANLQS